MNEYYFKTAFASEGDRDDIPLTAQTDGSVSFPQGWGPDYEKNLETQATAKAVNREVTNQLYYALTMAVGQYQRSGFPGWITASDNGGAAFGYAAGAQVLYSGQYWVSLQDGNTTTPGSGDAWQTTLYRVATDKEVYDGVDSRTFIVPSNLKTNLDGREKIINQSIKAISDALASYQTTNDAAVKKVSDNLDSYKTSNDAALKALKDSLDAHLTDYNQFKGDIDTAISNLNLALQSLSQTVSDNKREADQKFITEVRMGAGKTWNARNGDRNEFMPGGVMTSWSDVGSSNYWQTLRPMQFQRNGGWVNAAYDGGITQA